MKSRYIKAQSTDCLADPDASVVRSTRRESHPSLPFLLTAEEIASLLRTSREAVYAMAARAQIPGVTKLGRRIRFRRDDLLDWLDHNRTPSPKE